MLINMWRDGAQALRSLRRDLRFSIIVTITLLVVMGAVTTMISVIDAVLLKPLPFQQPDRLVAIWDSRPERGIERTPVSSANFLHWQEQSSAFEKMALVQQTPLTVEGLERPLQLTGTLVTDDFFPLLGIKPLHGRTFQAADFEPSSAPVTILGHGAWTTYFGADPTVVGSTILLNERPHLIAGVMPRQIYPLAALPSGRWEFGVDADQLWLPATDLSPTHDHVSGALGRLRDDVSVAAAREQLRLIAERLTREFPDTNQGYTVEVAPLREEVVGDVRTALFILLGAVAFLLLIACSNIASLFLVRAVARSREIALRVALGAGRRQIFRIFWVEGAMLMIFGGLGGVLLSKWLLRAIPQLMPETIPRLGESVLDWRVLLAALVAGLLSVTLFSAIPTVQVGWRSLRSVLEEGGRGGGLGARGARVMRLLVIGEIALAVLLLIGSGLLIQSFQRLKSVDLGFEARRLLIVELQNPRRLLIVELQNPPQDYPEMHDLTGFYDQLLRQIRTIPGVRTAVAAYDHPLVANWFQSFRIENAPEPPQGQRPQALFRTVTPGYMETLGLRILEGRDFTASDDARSGGVVLINSAFAREHFASGSPLGRRLLIRTTQWMWGDSVPDSFEIIGVVEDVRASGLESQPEPAFYLPFAQTPHRRMSLLVQTAREPRDVLPEVRAKLGELAPQLPMVSTATLQEVISDMVARPRFNAVFLGAFSAVALLLSIIGLWGVVSNSVLGRLREIGIRMAMGAQRKEILGLVVWDGLKPVLIGVLGGVIGAFFLGRLLESLLFGVASSDPVTFVAAPAALIIVALLACFWPAFRASRVDPMRVLRTE